MEADLYNAHTALKKLSAGVAALKEEPEKALDLARQGHHVYALYTKVSQAAEK